jgi:protein-S-isoprenylcysteine O-methyltransferase Ste14
MDPYLVVRSASVYIVVVVTIVAWAFRRPTKRVLAGALLGSVWNLPALLAVHVAASRFGWWRFDAEGALLIGMPVDLYLAWAWLWGAVPLLLFPIRTPIARVVAAAIAADVILMPLAFPVVRLGPTWLAGEAVACLTALVPGVLLARWTAADQRLVARATLQVLAFAGLLLFVVPAMAIEGSASTWHNPLTLPRWAISLLLQVMALPAVVGLTAVQEFVTRGGGTPVPFDPPHKLVTTGVYAYIRNPMQLAAVALLIVLGAVLANPWVAAAGAVAHIYSLGLAGWDEGEDLAQRFSNDWITYSRAVPRWFPRLRPWHSEGSAARLYVGANCDVCRGVGIWFARRHTTKLLIAPAESHPTRPLTRITYEAPDGSYSAEGVQALARALEHIHVGWAFVGWTLRLPAVNQFAQLLIDASGGEATPLHIHGHPRDDDIARQLPDGRVD